MKSETEIREALGLLQTMPCAALTPEQLRAIVALAIPLQWVLNGDATFEEVLTAFRFATERERVLAE